MWGEDRVYDREVNGVRMLVLTSVDSRELELDVGDGAEMVQTVFESLLRVLVGMVRFKLVKGVGAHLGDVVALADSRVLELDAEIV
jgi:hypothetical protein